VRTVSCRQASKFMAWIRQKIAESAKKFLPGELLCRPAVEAPSQPDLGVAAVCPVFCGHSSGEVQCDAMSNHLRV
jgi:hypothetical protein